MVDDPPEWAYGCWRPGDIVLEACLSFNHARKLTEDGGAVYRAYPWLECWVKTVESGAFDVIGLDSDDRYPTVIPFRRKVWIW